MDIPFRVEGMEVKDIKAAMKIDSDAAARLICTNCQFPLSPTSSASKVCCPRCNTWMDIDPACFGSCIKCHKTKQTEVSPCVEASLANSKEENEISCQATGRKNQRSFLRNVSFLLEKARDYLFGKVFL